MKGKIKVGPAMSNEQKPIEVMRCPGCGYLLAKKQWDMLYYRDIPCPRCNGYDISEYEEALV